MERFIKSKCVRIIYIYTNIPALLVFKMRNFALKMTSFALKMVNFALQLGTWIAPAASQPPVPLRNHPSTACRHRSAAAANSSSLGQRLGQHDGSGGAARGLHRVMCG